MAKTKTVRSKDNNDTWHSHLKCITAYMVSYGTDYWPGTTLVIHLTELEVNIDEGQPLLEASTEISLDQFNKWLANSGFKVVEIDKLM